jgi:hypothetical protein
MIWDPESKPEVEESAVAAFVTDQIAEWCGSDCREHSENVAELARAIDCFLKQRPSGEWTGSRQILGMASRALASLGENKAARKLFIYGTGMATPSEWMVSYGDSVLVLNLRQVTLCDDSRLELAFFASLNAALESVSDFWDETDGRGFLGLRRVLSTARSLLGCVGHNKVRMLAEEIKDACRARLECVADERDWEHVPFVVNLDLV